MSILDRLDERLRTATRKNKEMSARQNFKKQVLTDSNIDQVKTQVEQELRAEFQNKLNQQYNELSIDRDYVKSMMEHHAENQKNIGVYGEPALLGNTKRDLRKKFQGYIQNYSQKQAENERLAESPNRAGMQAQMPLKAQFEFDLHGHPHFGTDVSKHIDQNAQNSKETFEKIWDHVVQTEPNLSHDQKVNVSVQLTKEVLSAGRTADDVINRQTNKSLQEVAKSLEAFRRAAESNNVRAPSKLTADSFQKIIGQTQAMDKEFIKEIKKENNAILRLLKGGARGTGALVGGTVSQGSKAYDFARNANVKGWFPTILDLTIGNLFRLLTHSIWLTLFIFFIAWLGITLLVAGPTAFSLVGEGFSTVAAKTSTLNPIDSYKNFLEKQKRIFEGDYYQGVQENAQRELGVFVEDIQFIKPTFFEHEDILMFGRIRGEGLDQTQIIKTDLHCMVENRGALLNRFDFFNFFNSPVVNGTLRPQKIDLLGFGRQTFECSIPAGRIPAGTHNLNITAAFPFETNSYLLTYFMEKEIKQTYRSKGIDPLTEFAITDKNPTAIFTAGPVQIGMEFGADLPISVPRDCPNSDQCSTFLGITLDKAGFWSDGFIKQIKTVEITLPKGLSLSGPDNLISDCAPDIFKEEPTISSTGEKTYIFNVQSLKESFPDEFKKNQFAIENLRQGQTYRCRVFFEDPEALLEGAPLIPAGITVTTTYDFVSEINEILRVKEFVQTGPCDSDEFCSSLYKDKPACDLEKENDKKQFKGVCVQCLTNDHCTELAGENFECKSKKCVRK